MLAAYQFASNCPIDGIDLDGLEHYYTADGKLIGKIGSSTLARIVDSKNVKTVAFWINAANNPPKKADVGFTGRATTYANNYSFAKPNNDKPWYDLEGTDNVGNDRVAPGGPDAAGGSFGADGSVPGATGGGTRSLIESEKGTSKYTTVRGGLAGAINSSITVGPSLDFYWKTNEGKATPASKLLVGPSDFISIGGGINVTLSWTKNDKGKPTMIGLNIGIGAGVSSGKQFTFESIGKPK